MADCAPSIPEVSEGKSSKSSGRVAPDLLSIHGRESETSLADLCRQRGLDQGSPGLPQMQLLLDAVQ
jgi:hypothetical protein